MIPLFRLDFLALEEVLSNLESFELFNLSLLSKKATWLAKRAITKRNLEHNLCIFIYSTEVWVKIDKYAMKECKRDDDDDDDHSIYENEEYDDQRRTHERKYKGMEMEVECKKRKGKKLKKFDKIGYNSTFKRDDRYKCGTLTLHFNDLRIGFRRFLKQLLDFYSPKIEHAYVRSKFDIWIDTIKEFQSRKMKLLEFMLDTKNSMTNREICAVFDNLSGIELAEIWNLKPGKRFIQNDRRVYKLPSLHIREANWVTIDRLITMDCESLHLTGSDLKDADVSFFLNHWIKGGMKNLKELWLSAGHWKLGNILKKDPHKKNNNRRIWKINYEYGGEYDDDMYDIRRNDGVVGCVFGFTYRQRDLSPEPYYGDKASNSMF